MASEYPNRPMAPKAARYLCMVFGLAIIGNTIVYSSLHASRQELFPLIAGLLVGGGWFAFGKYGGFPLVDTVAVWHPPATPDGIEDMHRRGLRVMRRRRWIVWGAIPGAFVVVAVMFSLFDKVGHDEFMVLILGVPLALIHFRYYLSRCPRCGFGFFTKTVNRAAMIQRGNACGHCGLSIYDYKNS